MFVALFALLLSQTADCHFGTTTSTAAAQSIMEDESLRLAILVSEAQASAAHCLIKYQLLNQENLELEAGLGDAQDEIAHLRSSLTSSTAAVREISVEPSPIGWLIPVASALVVGAIGGGALAKAIWGH